MRGPALFQYHNLLAAVPPCGPPLRTTPSASPFRHSFVITHTRRTPRAEPARGLRPCLSPSPVRCLCCRRIVHGAAPGLLRRRCVSVPGSGEKLWLCAPPEKQREFDALLKRQEKAAGVRFTAKEKAYMQRHHIRAIHQRPGEAVYMSPGWPHSVKNLTGS